VKHKLVVVYSLLLTLLAQTVYSTSKKLVDLKIRARHDEFMHEVHTVESTKSHIFHTTFFFFIPSGLADFCKIKLIL
jgi:hypothetical protein